MAFEIYGELPQGTIIKGVLFDMDGVVLDTERLYARFWQEAALELGYDMSWQQALGMRSLNAQAGQQRLESYFGTGVSRDEFRAVRIRRMEAYIDRHGVEPKRGIFELLDHLDEQGIAKAITTSSPIERVEKYLSPLGLLDRFDRICTGYDVPKGKPEPDIYLYGAACLGLEPGVCLALEDSPSGVMSACSAGCVTVIVPDLDQPDESLKSMLYAKADSLTDVIGLLTKL